MTEDEFETLIDAYQDAQHNGTTSERAAARGDLKKAFRGALAARTPAAVWRATGEPDPHGTHYDCERAALTLGSLTDDELANGAFMNYDRRQSLDELLNPKPGQHMPIVWMTAVKDRIRWLSRALVKAQEANKV